MLIILNKYYDCDVSELHGIESALSFSIKLKADCTCPVRYVKVKSDYLSPCQMVRNRIN